MKKHLSRSFLKKIRFFEKIFLLPHFLQRHGGYAIISAEDKGEGPLGLSFYTLTADGAGRLGDEAAAAFHQNIDGVMLP